MTGMKPTKAEKKAMFKGLLRRAKLELHRCHFDAANLGLEEETRIRNALAHLASSEAEAERIGVPPSEPPLVLEVNLPDGFTEDLELLRRIDRARLDLGIGRGELVRRAVEAALVEREQIQAPDPTPEPETKTGGKEWKSGLEESLRSGGVEAAKAFISKWHESLTGRSSGVGEERSKAAALLRNAADKLEVWGSRPGVERDACVPLVQALSVLGLFELVGSRIVFPADGDPCYSGDASKPVWALVNTLKEDHLERTGVDLYVLGCQLQEKEFEFLREIEKAGRAPEVEEEVAESGACEHLWARCTVESTEGQFHTMVCLKCKSVSSSVPWIGEEGWEEKQEEIREQKRKEAMESGGLFRKSPGDES